MSSASVPVDSPEVYVYTALGKTRNGGWPEAKLHRARQISPERGYATACGKVLPHCDVYFKNPVVQPWQRCGRCFR